MKLLQWKYHLMKYVFVINGITHQIPCLWNLFFLGFKTLFVARIIDKFHWTQHWTFKTNDTRNTQKLFYCQNEKKQPSSIWSSNPFSVSLKFLVILFVFSITIIDGPLSKSVSFDIYTWTILSRYIGCDDWIFECKIGTTNNEFYNGCKQLLACHIFTHSSIK